MYKEIEVDGNLFYLERLLFSLDYFRFDDEIIELLNNLKSLIDKKLYSNLSLDNFDILEEKVKVGFFVEKNIDSDCCWWYDDNVIRQQHKLLE